MDRTLSELILGTRIVSLADLMIPLLFLGALIICRGGYPKRLLSFLFLVVVLSGLFILGETKEGPQYISARQGVSVLLAGCYAASVALYVGRYGYWILFRFVVAIAIVNSILIVCAGFFPEYFSDFLYRVTESGRTFAGVKFPFVRNSGLFGHYGYHGAYVMLAIVALYFLRSDGLVKRVLPWMMIMLAAIIVTQSRATWISMVILFLGLLAVKPLVSRSTVSQVRYMWTVFLMICTPFLSILGMNILEHLIEARERTFYSRLSGFEDAISLFLDSPILGKGYGSYYIAEQTNVLHNMTITVAYSTGIVGLILFVTLLFRPLFWRMPSDKKAALACLMLSVYALLNASSGLSYYSLWLIVGIIMGFGFFYRRTHAIALASQVGMPIEQGFRPAQPLRPGSA